MEEKEKVEDGRWNWWGMVDIVEEEDDDADDE